MSVWKQFPMPAVSSALLKVSEVNAVRCRREIMIFSERSRFTLWNQLWRQIPLRRPS